MEKIAFKYSCPAGQISIRIAQFDDKYSYGLHLVNHAFGEWDTRSWIINVSEFRLFNTESEAIKSIINQVIDGKLACSKVEEKLLQYKRTIPAPQLSLF